MERFFLYLLNLFNTLIAWMCTSQLLMYAIAIMVVYCLFGVVLNRILK